MNTRLHQITEVPQEIIDGFEGCNVKVNLWHYDDDNQNAIAYVTLDFDDIDESEIRFDTITGLWGYYNGFMKAMELMSP